MTVREFRNLLDDIEDQDTEIVIYGDEYGDTKIIDFDIDYYDSDEEDEFSDDYDEPITQIKDGTVIIVPTEFA